jgi:serine/threonine protein kinase
VVKTVRSVQTGEIHAVKVVDKSSVHDMIDLKNEISILYRLQNMSIVRLHEAFETKTHVSLVMER